MVGRDPEVGLLSLLPLDCALVGSSQSLKESKFLNFSISKENRVLLFLITIPDRKWFRILNFCGEKNGCDLVIRKSRRLRNHQLRTTALK